MNVSLEDLRNVDKRGKWWLVGSAWAGDPLVDRQQQVDEPLELDLAQDDEASLSEDKAKALLKLAKRQGMNTDVRRSIFVVLMSSEVGPIRRFSTLLGDNVLLRFQDYVDACDRLNHLKINDQQRPEIVRVLLHCLSNVSSSVKSEANCS